MRIEFPDGGDHDLLIVDRHLNVHLTSLLAARSPRPSGEGYRPDGGVVVPSRRVVDSLACRSHTERRSTTAVMPREEDQLSTFGDDPALVLEHLPDPVIVVDERMIITSANAAAGRLEVRDLAGRVVLRERIPQWSTIHEVALEGEVAGMYQCSLRWGVETMTTRVIIAAP